MTTRVYRLMPDPDDFQTLECSPDATAYLIGQTTDGTPRSATWTPVAVWTDGADLPVGDYPAFGEPAFSGRAVRALRDLLEPNGELLPLMSDAGEFYVYNVTNVVDALDVDRSRFDRLAEGRFSWIYRHAFRPEPLREQAIFKLPQLVRAASVYVTEHFVQRATEAGLAGMKFVEAWSETDGARWFDMFEAT